MEWLPACPECGVPGCCCEWCDFCERSVNPWVHFGPDHDHGQMLRHVRLAASGATLPLDGCPPGCRYCTRLAELIAEAGRTA